MKEIKPSDTALNAEKKPKELGRETKCGSAVLTALQAPHLPIRKVAKLVKKRRVHAFLKGADLNKWMDVFWHNFGLVIAAEIAKKMGVEDSE